MFTFNDGYYYNSQGYTDITASSMVWSVEYRDQERGDYEAL